MKRIIATVLALVMVFCAVGALAEESKNDYGKNLATMFLLYKLSPNDISPDHVIYTYLNLNAYFNEEMMNMYYLTYSLKSGEDLYNSIRNVAASSAKITKDITDVYNDWLNGNTTYMKCMDYLMEIFEAIVDSKSK